MKGSFLKGWGILLLGFFLGVFAALTMQSLTSPDNGKPPDKGVVITDPSSLDTVVRINKKLTPTVISDTVVLQEVRLVVSDYSNFITSPPVAGRQNFDAVEFTIYKNDYKLPLKLPRFWVGLGYGYPLGIRVSAGYRLMGNMMLYTIIDSMSVSVSTALFLF
jgi:hypothetical protein